MSVKQEAEIPFVPPSDDPYMLGVVRDVRHAVDAAQPGRLFCVSMQMSFHLKDCNHTGTILYFLCTA